MPYDPSLYGIFWGIFFANIGAGGGGVVESVIRSNLSTSTVP